MKYPQRKVNEKKEFPNPPAGIIMNIFVSLVSVIFTKINKKSKVHLNCALSYNFEIMQCIQKSVKLAQLDMNLSFR